MHCSLDRRLLEWQSSFLLLHLIEVKCNNDFCAGSSCNGALTRSSYRLIMALRAEKSCFFRIMLNIGPCMLTSSVPQFSSCGYPPSYRTCFAMKYPSAGKASPSRVVAFNFVHGP